MAIVDPLYDPTQPPTDALPGDLWGGAPPQIPIDTSPPTEPWPTGPSPTEPPPIDTSQQQQATGSTWQPMGQAGVQAWRSSSQAQPFERASGLFSGGIGASGGGWGGSGGWMRGRAPGESQNQRFGGVMSPRARAMAFRDRMLALMNPGVAPRTSRTPQGF